MTIANVEERKDDPTVDAVSRLRELGIEGVRFERLAPHTDHRGHLTQIMNSVSPIWNEPVVHAYHVTVKPGRIKGWGMHLLQADRHYPFAGEGRMVLYDGRDNSPTHGEIVQIGFSDVSRGVLYIPPGVWHAAQCTGDTDWQMINFPTRPYDADNPDKYRTDPHEGEIPFDFSLRDG
jgi:dTDP-4-dehydrorhamnose 3,5-epimerase